MPAVDLVDYAIRGGMPASFRLRVVATNSDRLFINCWWLSATVGDAGHLLWARQVSNL
jgi:succinylarginine dihydrolase